MSKENKKARNPCGGLIDRLTLPALQAITDRLYLSKGHEPANQTRLQALSLGFSPNPHNRNLLDELFIDLPLLMRHLYIVGQTGIGKTFLIFLLVRELIRLGCGFCVVDIHGDLTQMILSHLASLEATPAQREMVEKKLVLLLPFDPDFALTFNPLHAPDEKKAYLQVSDMLHHFRKEWKDSWGPRMDLIFRHCLTTLSLRGMTLSDVPRFLIDANFRAVVVSELTDPIERSFWLNEFESQSDAMKLTVVQPVLNKVAPFVDDFYLRHMFAQRHSAIDFRQAMDDRKWILVNVPKGIAGENAHLAGSLSVSSVRTAAMSRVDIPEEDRIPFTLIADEFQCYVHYDFEEILSEARKFRLGLVMAHQHLDQIERSMRAAIFGNVASTFLFRLGHQDVREVASSFRSSDQLLVSNALANLGNGEVVQRQPDGSFRILKIHRINKPEASPEAIARLREASYRQYYRRRSEIDAELLARTQPSGVSAVSPVGRPAPAPPRAGRLLQGRNRHRNEPPETQLPEGEL